MFRTGTEVVWLSAVTSSREMFSWYRTGSPTSGLLQLTSGVVPTPDTGCRASWSTPAFEWHVPTIAGAGISLTDEGVSIQGTRDAEYVDCELLSSGCFEAAWGVEGCKDRSWLYADHVPCPTWAHQDNSCEPESAQEKKPGSKAKDAVQEK